MGPSKVVTPCAKSLTGLQVSRDVPPKMTRDFSPTPSKNNYLMAAACFFPPLACRSQHIANIEHSYKPRHRTRRIPCSPGVVVKPHLSLGTRDKSSTSLRVLGHFLRRSRLRICCLLWCDGPTKGLSKARNTPQRKIGQSAKRKMGQRKGRQMAAKTQKGRATQGKTRRHTRCFLSGVTNGETDRARRDRVEHGRRDEAAKGARTDQSSFRGHRRRCRCCGTGQRPEEAKLGFAASQELWLPVAGSARGQSFRRTFLALASFLARAASSSAFFFKSACFFA